jgi:hypothetical protein
VALAAPVSPLQGPYSPALVGCIPGATGRSRVAKGREGGLRHSLKAYEWERQHPQPKSRKGIRKWIKKAGKVNDALVRSSWLEPLDAERTFADAQLGICQDPAS